MIYYISDDLMKKINDLYTEFQRKIGEIIGCQYLCINEANVGTIGEFSGEIHREYRRMIDILNRYSNYKVEVYIKNIGGSLIDYHLFAALYIRSFFVYPPFSLEIPRYSSDFIPSKYTNFPNEYFIIYFLEAIFQIRNNDFIKRLRLDNEFKIDFVNSLSRYKENINLLNIITFANEIGIIENKYFF
jgi:hypothetical protein